MDGEGPSVTFKIPSLYWLVLIMRNRQFCSTVFSQHRPSYFAVVVIKLDALMRAARNISRQGRDGVWGRRFMSILGQA